MLIIMSNNFEMQHTGKSITTSKQLKKPATKKLPDDYKLGRFGESFCLCSFNCVCALTKTCLCWTNNTDRLLATSLLSLQMFCAAEARSPQNTKETGDFGVLCIPTCKTTLTRAASFTRVGLSPTLPMRYEMRAATL